MLGQLLLRLLYRLPLPRGIYADAVRAACRTGARLVVDVGGGSAGLHAPLRQLCPHADYLLLELDASLASARPLGVEAVVADARSPPLRALDAVAVFHDSLHHIPGWRGALSEMLAPYRCVVVSDYDASTRPGRLLALLEKLLGFPAEFTTPDELAEALRDAGFEPRIERRGFNYLVSACRAWAVKRGHGSEPPRGP